jgi:hypothetical protein
MTTKKIIATTAMAALAFPAAAVADKPADKPAKPTKAQKAKGVGFSVAGVDLTGLTVTDGKLAGALTLDPTSANKHARTLLDLTKTEIAGQDTVQLGTAGDAVLVRYKGLTATDALQPTDRVKVIGKVIGRKSATPTLDIRKITVTRGDTEETSTTTSTSKSSTRQSPAEQCKGKSRKKAAGETKSAYSKCVSAAAKAQNDDDSDSDSDKS